MNSSWVTSLYRDSASRQVQLIVACEVRVNLNYSTEIHFTLFY